MTWRDLMGLGKNKGHSYEEKIAKILETKNITMPSGGPAGSSDGSDLTFLHNNKEISFEMKNNVKDPDYGQCVVIPKKTGKKWIWDWSPHSKKKKPEVIEFYNNLKCTDGSIGVLKYINKKNLTPNKYRLDNSELTKNSKLQDLKNFEDSKNKISVEAFSLFYKKKSIYLQVGKGFGFYHINDDVADLGTEKFDAEFILRLRAKSHFNHHPVCSECKKQYRPPTETCNKCKKELKLPDNKKKDCPDCGFPTEYKKFKHVWWDYSFIVVLKCKKILKISKLNIEPTKNQKFPPIEP